MQCKKRRSSWCVRRPGLRHSTAQAPPKEKRAPYGPVTRPRCRSPHQRTAALPARTDRPDHGRSHCTCAAAPETTAHVYLRCPKYAVDTSRSLDGDIAAWCDEVVAGQRGAPRPDDADALRWANENTEQVNGHLLQGRACNGNELGLAAHVFAGRRRPSCDV